MEVKIHNVFTKWPLEDKSVQAIITSPPYWSLRKYDIPDVVIGDWKGQHGLEPTFQQYIEHTRLWAKEAWRVLRDDGVFFLNLGDSYGGTKEGNDNPKFPQVNTKQFTKKTPGYKSKCKILIPHRVAISLIDDGWILRNDLIWYKPNAMPESVTDRFSKKFEYIFMFTKQSKYYFDLDAVREEHKYLEADSQRSDFNLPSNVTDKTQQFSKSRNSRPRSEDYHDRGKNPGDLWTINTQPSPFKHYAMWSEKLVERMIKCSTKAGDTVCDPFAGSGTTLYVAEKLNRKGIGFDLGYEDIQKIRLSEIQKSLL